MRKRFLTKLTAIMLVVLMVFSLCACVGNDTQSASYPKNGARKIVTTEKMVYTYSTETLPLTVAHYENEPEILLVEIKDIVRECITELGLALYPNTSMKVEETDSTVTLTRENGAYCVIDFVKDTIYFSDFDNFSILGFKTNPFDLLSHDYLNDQGESVFLKRNLSFYTPGRSIELNLAERGIPLDIYDGKKYIPLQTFNDLFFNTYGYNFAYNGQTLFLLAGITLIDEMKDMYYLEQPTPRTEALTEFNYKEFCLFLDVYYGMKEAHGVYNGFEEFFERTGLKEKMLSNNAMDFYNALGTLCFGYIADSHTGIYAASPYLAEEQPSTGKDIKPSPEILVKNETKQAFVDAREKELGKEVDIYQKIGNTAYVTFDEFSLSPRNSYDEKTGDVLDIINYAHTQISQDEEIENVVVDLSCNIGGAVDSALYLASWMLGPCNFSVYNSLSGSRAITNYIADINLDGEFDEDDTITDKNLYCLVSPISFSCANAVAAILKDSGLVTVVGQTSGGGTCVVRQGVTADGTRFNISDFKQMSIVKNGTFYNIDAGVEPHIALSKIESFYDRDVLTEYLNKLK